jgi:hypothetical protein
MLTFKGYIDGIHVTIYSSTMDPMGMGTYDYQTYENESVAFRGMIHHVCSRFFTVKPLFTSGISQEIAMFDVWVFPLYPNSYPKLYPINP